MAKKAIAKKIKQLVTDEINHPPFIRTQIPANRASAAPPLGTMLGQVSQYDYLIIKLTNRFILKKREALILHNFAKIIMN